MDDESDLDYESNQWSIDLLPDILQNLIKLDDLYKPNQDVTLNYEHFESLISAIYDVCEYFDVEHQIKYETIDLFSRFINDHTINVKHGAEESLRTSPGTDHTHFWDEIKTRLKNQALLRFLSCLSIVSKLYHHVKCIPAAQIINYLNLTGLNLHPTPEMLLKSELRVLKTLNYIKLPSLLELTETILSAIKNNLPSLNPNIFYPLIYSILDIIYLDKKYFYNEISEISSQLNSKG